MNKTISILITCLLIITSCTEEEMEIDVPEKKSKLVVYSTLVPFILPQPKQLRVKVTNTKHIFDTSAQQIKDAQILLFNNNICVDTLNYIDSLGYYPINFHPSVDDKLSIRVKKEGFESINASTQIPEKVNITDTNIIPISYLENGNAHSEISVSFKDPVDQKNYYAIRVSDIAYSEYNERDFYKLTTNDPIITSESYYPSIMNFNLDNPKELLFTDETINGKTHTLNIYYYPPQGSSAKNWISDHFIRIHLRNVTKEYFQYKTSLIQHLNNKEEDFLYGMGEPIDVVSNIENGYGLFAGFNNDIVSMHINKIYYQTNETNTGN